MLSCSCCNSCHLWTFFGKVTTKGSQQNQQKKHGFPPANMCLSKNRLAHSIHWLIIFQNSDPLVGHKVLRKSHPHAAAASPSASDRSRPGPRDAAVASGPPWDPGHPWCSCAKDQGPMAFCVDFSTHCGEPGFILVIVWFAGYLRI